MVMNKEQHKFKKVIKARRKHEKKKAIRQEHQIYEAKKKKASKTVHN